MPDLSGRVRGGYVTRDKMGDGDDGEVYRADHRERRRVAAIQVMNEARRNQDDAAAAVRFRREAQLASQLRHSSATHVYGPGVAAPEADDAVMWIAGLAVAGVVP